MEMRFLLFPPFSFLIFWVGCAGVVSLFLNSLPDCGRPRWKYKMNEEQNKSGTLRSELISTIIYESFIFIFIQLRGHFRLEKKKNFIERRVPLILCPCKMAGAKGEAEPAVLFLFASLLSLALV